MRRIVFIALTVLVLSIRCYAVSPVEQLYQQFEIDKLKDQLPTETVEITESIFRDGFSIEDIASISPSQLLSVIKEQVKKAVVLYRGELLSVIAAVLISAMVGTVSDTGSQNDIFDLICTLIITAIMVSPVLDCISNSCRAINDISRFMLSYIPIYTSVMAASGMVSGAAVYQTLVFAASQIISQLSNNLFTPVLQGYMLLSLTGAISKNNSIAMLGVSIKKVIVWGLTFISTVFTGILSLQNIIGSATDSAFSKTAKFLMGSFVPVIGGAFADALSVVNGSMRIIKAMVGGIGVAAAVIGFLPTLIDVTVLRAVIWIGKFIGEAISASGAKTMLSGLYDVLTLTTAILVCSLLLMAISTAIMMTFASTSAAI